MSFLFKVSKIYENKLSEQIKTDSWAKRKLIEMETPSQKSPIYSFLSIGLLAYVWIFLFTLIYNRAYGYEMAILVVVFTTTSVLFSYKKLYLTSIEAKYNRFFCIMFFIIALFSIVIASMDSGDFYIHDLKNTFLFFLEINDKSYIALSILAFFTLGIAICYYSCPYELYRVFYSANKERGHEKNEEIQINKWFRLSIVFILGIILLMIISLKPRGDSYEVLLKNLSMIGFFCFPAFLTTSFPVKKYIKIYKMAKEYDNKLSNKG